MNTSSTTAATGLAPRRARRDDYHAPKTHSCGAYGAKNMDNSEVLRLLARIEKGDEGAFRELYRAFSRRLYAYVLRQHGDPTKAEEIVADTLYEVWRQPARFRGDSQFTTWLIGIARNKVLMSFRGRRFDEKHDDLDDVAETLASDDAGPFEQLAHQQHREGVRSCMDKLSDEHRECVHLVFYEGLSLAEVASVQACPEGTVKTRLFHARQKLKQCLQNVLRSERSPLAGAAGAAT